MLFQVELANVWFNYKTHDGQPLKIRPHWAKELPESVEYNGTTYSGTEYLKMIYKEDMKIFRNHLKQVCDDGGYTIADLKSIFSNDYLDDIFTDLWGDWD